MRRTEFASWTVGEVKMFRLELHERDIDSMEQWRLEQIMSGLQTVESALADYDPENK